MQPKADSNRNNRTRPRMRQFSEKETRASDHAVRYGVACTSLAWIAGAVGRPVGEPPTGSSEMP